MSIATDVMLKIREQLGDFEKQVKQYAEEPYGMKKATPKEQMDKYNNLTEADLFEMIDKQGIDEVNKWLYKMEKKSEQIR